MRGGAETYFSFYLQQVFRYKLFLDELTFLKIDFTPESDRFVSTWLSGEEEFLFLSVT